MPYLSKIRINPRRPQALRLLGNPHFLHGAVLAGFPGEVAERVLWRVDADNPRRLHLLVLTQHTRPDWTHLVEQAGWPGADGDHFLIRDYAPLLDRLATGQEYAFRLHASPVQNTHTPEKPTP
ncbi:type I-E CRISPR-associated protein Cas6/Cse3/CasE, partial [Streptomyces sp. 8K308]|uniref:type I-E CRISPR-associated protein Cas6/Cse3/CasE n=1 Tax=Streptomyces sp. 8K308 TaxID=2530388 RepID=UPI00104CE3AB